MVVTDEEVRAVRSKGGQPHRCHGFAAASHRQMRLACSDAATRKLADYPHLFRETNKPETYIIVPSVSSERRHYVPMGFLKAGTIPTNLVLIIPNATLYHFGILPWPTPTEKQKEKIAQTAQQIIDARAMFPDSSLADLYDELTMPPELRHAHQQNDRAVMEAYGFPVKNEFTESLCVAELFKRYQELTLCQKR